MRWPGVDAVGEEPLLAVVLQPEKSRPFWVAPIVEERRDDDVKVAIVIEVAGHCAIGAIAAVDVVPDEIQVSPVLQPLHAVVRAGNDGRQIQVVAIRKQDVLVAILIKVHQLNAG